MSEAQINANLDLLKQKDYRGRKVAFEVAKLFKAQFPNAEMPNLDKYLADEEEADLLRAEIDNQSRG